MGWSKGDLVFDPVAYALNEYRVPADVKEDVCVALIKGLQECDWDCESESLALFLDDPAIVAAFARCGVTWEESW